MTHTLPEYLKKKFIEEFGVAYQMNKEGTELVTQVSFITIQKFIPFLQEVYEVGFSDGYKTGMADTSKYSKAYSQDAQKALESYLKGKISIDQAFELIKKIKNAKQINHKGEKDSAE